MNFKNKKLSADVYEFKEDSEEEVKRPRLILTIKNPIEPPVPPVTAVSETSVITEYKPSVTNQPTAAIAVSSATSAKNSSANTRKSRRLQV